MPEPTEQVRTCDACGATIYPEHIEKHVARNIDGRLLCKHCVEEQEAALVDAPIALEDDPVPATQQAPPPRIRHNRPAQAAHADEAHFRRQPDPESPHATRAKTFHCRLTDASMTHLDEMINEWADAREHVRIKFATSTVGVIEGKHADPHLVVTVFY